MRQYFLLSILFFIGLCHPVHAYEFKQIDTFFQAIETEYTQEIDLKDLALNTGADALEKFSSQFKLYSNQSNAFLYHNNQFLGQFSLPSHSKSPLWQKFIKDIYNKALLSSSFSERAAQKLERAFLQSVLQKFDKFSRIEEKKSTQVTLDYFLRDNVLYIKLPDFNAGESAALQKIISQNLTIGGLVLDLRGNRGGLFNEALKTAGLFLDNTLIAYSVEKKHLKRFYNSGVGDILSGKDIVILTDEHTASAAEIVAAALSEQGRAIIIGTQTYGKGTIQQVHHMENQILYLTSGYFYSPSGKQINLQGVTPEICTGINHSCRISDKTDPQRDIFTAIDMIKKRLS